jgi:hypothetical protein
MWHSGPYAMEYFSWLCRGIVWLQREGDPSESTASLLIIHIYPLCHSLSLSLSLTLSLSLSLSLSPTSILSVSTNARAPELAGADPPGTLPGTPRARDVLLSMGAPKSSRRRASCPTPASTARQHVATPTTLMRTATMAATPGHPLTAARAAPAISPGALGVFATPEPAARCPQVGTGPASGVHELTG